MEYKTTELKKAWQELDGDIRKGLFTPFLGAGASSLRSGEIDPDSYPWKDVAKTLTAIAAPLKTVRSLDFLRSFTMQRLRLSDEMSRDIVPAVPFSARPASWPPIAPELSDSLLVKLQVEIVRAAVRLTNYFGKRFSKDCPSIQRLEDCSVSFDVKSSDAKDSLAGLFTAADIALEMTRTDVESPFLEEVPGTRRRLERQRIHQRLLTLIVGLAGSHRKACEGQLAKHYVGKNLGIPEDVDRGEGDDFGRLRLDAVQWMSELLWYTVRYWVPWYPTTAELAFELSLAVKHAPPRRAELAQAAQALENEKVEAPPALPKVVRDLVTYCERVQQQRGGLNRETAAFYYGIAAVLRHQFDLYRDELERRQKQERGGGLKDQFATRKPVDDAGNGRGNLQRRVPVPLIFTTNFDSALEKVFDANEVSYHVVFPVLRGAKSGDEASSTVPDIPTWMFETRRPESEGEQEGLREWSDISDENGTPWIGLDGPIIVKLHGAPSMRRSIDISQHWLVLSEVGYLQALGNEFRAPDWLAKQLSWASDEKEIANPTANMQRALWFLGYSISDWNVRLRLYEHCKERGNRRNTVDRAADVYRTAILQRLGVAQCVGDLTDLPGLILLALQDDNFEKSPKVKRLTEKLEKLEKQQGRVR